MSKPRRVKHCKQSTITEAWAVVQGQALPFVDNNEIGASVHSIQKEFPDTKVIPAIVVVQSDGKGPIAPFWQTQLSFNHGSQLARVGHQYLSIHFMRPGEGKYDKYETSFEPSAKRVVNLWTSTFSPARSKMPVSLLGFGYINTFDFPKKDFDLSHYFKFSFGIVISEIDIALSGLKTMFNLVDQKTGTPLNVELEISDSPAGSDSIRIMTRILAQSPPTKSILVGDKNAILSEIKQVKEVAKTAFFGFTTDKTHELMGAVYV